MQIKKYNAYRITHKDGVTEHINAENLLQALQNMSKKETDSPVIQTFMVKEGVDTLVEEAPTEVLFTAVCSEGGNLSLATPSTGKIHVGDQIQLKAIPDRNYQFVSWKRNGTEISKEADFLYTMSELAESEDTAVLTATFEAADVNWTTSVTPSEATGTGCVAFPPGGKAKPEETLTLLAVDSAQYKFTKWTRNGVEVSTAKQANIKVTPLAKGEENCVYVAEFSKVGGD